MELLDIYVKAVKACLPKGQRDDIAKELSQNLLAQMEDKEAELGRPLNEAEQEAILKRHGHPVLVASRYRQDQGSLAFGRVLIGPALFPFYVRILGINLVITAVVCLVVTVALDKPIPESLPAILTHLLVWFGAVTLIFIAVQRHLTRSPDRWDPRDPLGSPPPVKNDTPRVSRFESFVELAAYSVFLYWVVALRHSAGLALDAEAAPVRLGPVWQQVYWPVVLVLLAQIVQACVNLVRPDWVGFRSVANVAASGVWLVILGYLVLAGDWVVLTDAAEGLGTDSLRKVEAVNHYFFFYGLLVTTVVVAVCFLVEVRQLVRHRQLRVPAAVS
jgi:hypothetical protein